MFHPLSLVMGGLYSNYLGFGKVVVPGLLVFVPNHPEIAQGKDQSRQELADHFAQESGHIGHGQGIYADNLYLEGDFAGGLAAGADKIDVIGDGDGQRKEIGDDADGVAVDESGYRAQN